jgi:hypothetical protein
MCIQGLIAMSTSKGHSMADSFSIHQITHYPRQMGIEIARLDDGRDFGKEKQAQYRRDRIGTIACVPCATGLHDSYSPSLSESAGELR